MGWAPGMIAVDPTGGAFKDRVYAVWNDGRIKRSAIMLSFSSDSAKTWSKPQVIDDVVGGESTGADNFMAEAAVNKSGVVGVMWYDRREDPLNPGYTARFRASLDGGDTWLPSVKVSEAEQSFGKSEDWNVIAAGSQAT